jgi:myo-inositol 2-dehydrogenase / D-chiro-inositol 1-dehydrogenase
LDVIFFCSGSGSRQEIEMNVLLSRSTAAAIMAMGSSRRSFSMAVQRAKLSTATAGSACGTRHQRKARVVLVGSGRMGHIRASLLRGNPRLDLVGIVDKDRDAGRALGEMYGVSAIIMDGRETCALLIRLLPKFRKNAHCAPTFDRITTGNKKKQVESFECLDEAVMDKNKKRRLLDGIVISSPTSTHGSIIRNAADHKISVFTEKPVAETAEQIQSIFDYTDAAGIALCCSFQRRFDPTYVAVTNMVQSGDIGNAIVMASIFFADHPMPPREFLLEGGNIFMDLSAHDVDYITHTLNDKVVSVYASGTSSDPDLAVAGIHDNATMVMKMQKGTARLGTARHCTARYAAASSYNSNSTLTHYFAPAKRAFLFLRMLTISGAVVTMFMSRSATYGYDQRCEIFGNLGLASVGNPPEHAAKLFNAHGSHSSRLQHSFPQRFEEAFALELDAFANVLLNNDNDNTTGSSICWPVTAEQCIHVQQVADAARLSCETGAVVQLKPNNEHVV